MNNEITIRCLNPKCGADNPHRAKFCRKCGTAFDDKERVRQLAASVLELLRVKIKNLSGQLIRRNQVSMFTLDTFKDIDFKPTSVVDIKFTNKRSWVYLVILSVLFGFSVSDWGVAVIRSMIEEYDIGFLNLAKWFVLIPIGVIIVSNTRKFFKKIRFNVNADYIEDNFLNKEIVRVAKKNQMGLFDKKRLKVLLSSKFDNIVKFDSMHLLLVKGGLKGLYSIRYKKIIIPIEYTDISLFVNSVIKTTKGNGGCFHYDVKGNRLR